MRFKMTLTISFCLLWVIGCKDATKEVMQKGGKVVVESKEKTPVGTFIDLEGNSVELGDYKGKKVLLNFWATWCRPCIEEMPSLLLAEAALKEDNYVFLLASDQSMDKIKSFKEKKGFNFNFLKLNGPLADFEVTALPATFVYNEEGKLVSRFDGATEWAEPNMLDKLRAIK